MITVSPGGIEDALGTNGMLTGREVMEEMNLKLLKPGQDGEEEG